MSEQAATELWAIHDAIVAEFDFRMADLKARMCGRKRTYTKEGAKRAIAMMKCQGKSGVNAYRCPFCVKWWHVGHPPSKERR